MIEFLSVAVVVAFFLCWAPFHAQRLMAIYVQNQTPTAVFVYTVLTHISGVTYYLSATINPILYSIMSKKFRLAFKHSFMPCQMNVYGLMIKIGKFSVIIYSSSKTTTTFTSNSILKLLVTKVGQVNSLGNIM